MKIDDLQGFLYKFIPFEDEELEIMLIDYVIYDNRKYSCFYVVDEIEEGAEDEAEYYFYEGDIINDAYDENKMVNDQPLCEILFELIMK